MYRGREECQGTARPEAGQRVSPVPHMLLTVRGHPLSHPLPKLNCVFGAPEYHLVTPCAKPLYISRCMYVSEEARLQHTLPQVSGQQDQAQPWHDFTK